jgi:hypothetical protein
MMKRLLIYSLFIFLSANWVGAQCIGTCTTVTATLTDNSTQAWSFATVTINLVKPFGYAGQMLNNGVPVNSPQNNIQADGTGTFTISLDDNVALTPAGSKWIFTFCPNATVANCSQLTQIVTGGSMNLSSIITNVLTIPIVNSTPTIYRAYSDTEALGGQGSLYWRTTDNTLRGCIIMPCPSNWIAIGTGGGGGSGTVNIGNLNFIPKYVTNPSGTVVGPDVNLDDGVTAANTLTYKGANGFNLPSDGVHSGSVQVGGNTTLPGLANNAFGWIGPNSASFSSYFLQPDNVGPTNTNTTLTCTLPVGNVSPCTWGPPPSGSGITGTGTSPQLAVWTGTSALGNSGIQASATSVTFGNISALTGGTGFTEVNSVSSACGGTNNFPAPVPGCAGYNLLFSPIGGTGTVTSGMWLRNAGNGGAETLKMGLYAHTNNNFGVTEERTIYAEAYDLANSVVATRRALFAFAGNATGNTSAINEAIYAQTYVAASGSSNTTDYTIEVAAPTITAPATMGTHASVHIDAPGFGVAMQMGTQAFASLPTCNSTYEGSLMPVTDSSTVVWGATITGSSTHHVLAYCDGTNWTVAAI